MSVRMISPVVESTIFFSRTSANPAILLPGSSFNRSGCNTESACNRSTSRIVKGTMQWTRARSRSSINRARFSEHGISVFPSVQNEYSHFSPPKKSLRTLVTQAIACIPSGMSATGSYL